MKSVTRATLIPGDPTTFIKNFLPAEAVYDEVSTVCGENSGQEDKSCEEIHEEENWQESCKGKGDKARSAEYKIKSKNLQKSLKIKSEKVVSIAVRRGVLQPAEIATELLKNCW